jgi:hypothetical protein
MGKYNSVKAEIVSIRDVFAIEPEFSAWLSANLDVLQHAVGLILKDGDAEVPTGSMRADVVAFIEGGDATTGEDAKAVIECQFGDSDHKHLGQILTYMANHRIRTGIWLTEGARPEHIEAVRLINEARFLDLYLVTASAVRVGSGNAAPLFTTVEGPNPELRASQQESDVEASLNREFWTEFLRNPKTEQTPFAGRRPTAGTALYVAHGTVPSLEWQVWANKSSTRAALKAKHSDDDVPTEVEVLKGALSELGKLSGAEVTFGSNPKSSVFSIEASSGGSADARENWPATCTALAEAITRLKGAVDVVLSKGHPTKAPTA